jgi:peptide/nickel transport system permease protein
VVKSWLSSFKKSPTLIIGLPIVIFYVVLALLAPVLAHPITSDPFIIFHDGYSQIPLPPGTPVNSSFDRSFGWTVHYFGVAQGGLDIYYGCVWGTVFAFRIGFLVALAALAAGLAVGVTSGYLQILGESMTKSTGTRAIGGHFAGAIGELIIRFTDVLLALGLILAMALTLGVGASTLGFTLTMADKIELALFTIGFPIYSRIIRREIIKIKKTDRSEAKPNGSKTRHPAIDFAYTTVSMLFLGIGPVVLTAAAMSFLGIGSPVGYADWGQMISMARNWIWAGSANPWQYWYTFVIPGLFLFTFVLGWILFGVGFRDIFGKSGETP